MIEQYGGIVINIVECCSFQVCPDCDENLEEFFRKGYVFKESWIVESITAQKILCPMTLDKKYLKYHITKEFKRHTSFSRTKFTIREIMKIFDVIAKYP